MLDRVEVVLQPVPSQCYFNLSGTDVFQPSFPSQYERRAVILTLFYKPT